MNRPLKALSLTNAAQSELVTLARQGDPSAIERLIRANLRNAASVIRGIHGIEGVWRKQSHIEDLWSEAVIAIILATRTFDASAGPFGPWAILGIRDRLRNYIHGLPATRQASGRFSRSIGLNTSMGAGRLSLAEILPAPQFNAEEQSASQHDCRECGQPTKAYDSRGIAGNAVRHVRRYVECENGHKTTLFIRNGVTTARATVSDGNRRETHGIRCPTCGGKSKTIEVRKTKVGKRRRRECVDGHRFTTDQAKDGRETARK